MGQGGPVTGGAQGFITINTAQLAQARAAVQQFATGVNTTLTGVSKGAAQAQAGVSGLAGAFTQLGSAFGLSFSVAGVVQLGKMAVAASETATAYARQGVAARNLAGSQDQLNAKLAAYDKATGGVVDKATALANVTKLMAVGFADDVPELTKFATAIRGISIAMNESPDKVTGDLILELFTQRGARLDQLGLDYGIAKKRADELQASDSSLTAKMAYQNAVMEQAEQRFGKLAKSGEGAKTGMEAAGTSASNLSLVIGQVLGPTINGVGADFSRTLDRWGAGLQAAINLTKQLAVAAHLIAPTASETIGRRSSLGSGLQQPFARMDRTPLEGEKQIHLDWAKGVQDVNAQMHADIIDEERSFGASRAKTVADYNKSVARDEAAYARGRLRANLDFLDSLADVANDATRREAGMAADLARTQSSARADSAEREVDARKDAGKRLAKLDEDYEKDRIKAAQKLSDDMLDAAGDLDAKQVYELQRDAAKQAKEAADAHTDARKEIGDGLQERLDDEAKSLAKSLKQQQDAYDRQITEGRENDRLRLEDMKAAFAKQQDRAKEDHDDQVTQRAEDQAAQLTEMDTQHGLRMTQIAVHAAAERGALDEQAKIDLLALGVRNDAWKKVQDAKELAQEKLWDKLMEHIGLTLQGPKAGPKEPAATFPTILHPPSFASGGYVPSTGLAFLHRGEYVMPARAVASMTTHSNNSRAINIHPGAVVIHAAPGMDEDYLVRKAIDGLIDALEAA